MRRSASEVIRDLETRIARLEKQSAKVPKYKLQQQKDLNEFIAFCATYGLEEAGDTANVDGLKFLRMLKNKFGHKGVKNIGDGKVVLTIFGEQVLNENA